jgi:lipid-binding SYLF domain-containing protein
MKPHTVVFTLLAVIAVSGAAAAVDPVTEAHQTLDLFLKTDPGLRTMLERSAGYAVLPSITKAAVGVGGAHGSGVVFDHTGTPVARVSMTQATIGIALGAQTYSEVIVFEHAKAFSNFKGGDFTMAAQMSAVALAKGAAASAKYSNGVAVFTATNSGLMFEASVGGQKFNVKPLK